ncbi:MAG: ABC transporter permease [Solirubrobacterales bacterium]|nr:ABC transporter permease [Solirubrobacterales bacterium]
MSAHGTGPWRDLRLVGWQVYYEQRGFWRNRRRAIASFAFPLMFLLIFGALQQGRHLTSSGHSVAYINFYVPGMIAYAVLVIGFSNTAMAIALLRAEGVLKRVRATPMPWPLYLAGIVLSTMVTIAVACVLLLVVGAALYKAQIHSPAIPGLLVTVALATICFTSLGIAVSRLIQKPDSGMPVLMLVTLPLTFISNVFFPLEGKGFVVQLGKLFPLRPLAEGIQPAFTQAHGAGFSGHDLTTLAIWSAVGCWLMVRTMRKISAEE